MTKEVLVTISGLQFLELEGGEKQNDTVKVVAPADYFYKNGKHYVIYDEVTEGIKGHTKNQIKISEGPVIQVKKTGLVNSMMVFEKGESHLTCYQTPFGEMMLGVTTGYIHLEENEDRIDVQIDYELNVNYEPLAECQICISIQSKEKAEV